MTKHNVLILPGDGIGAEVMPHVVRVMKAASQGQAELDISTADIGGIAIDRYGRPLPKETLDAARQSDAILLGSVGGPKWDHLAMDDRPERGLLQIRAALDLYANLRPAVAFPSLESASSLKTELVTNLDILIVRELTGGIYFGVPRGIEHAKEGRRGYNTFEYDEHQIARIARTAFDLARQRGRRLCSVDKANVLEVTQLWREVVTEVHADYPDVELSHMYVDNAGMQLVRHPNQFDVMVTGNMFGDILSDVAAMLTGSLGMLPSASLNASAQGLFEPVHGSAPDIAGQNIANPLATILSGAMMFRYSLSEVDIADRLERSVADVLRRFRTPDIMPPETTAELTLVSTDEMADAVIAALDGCSGLYSGKNHRRHCRCHGCRGYCHAGAPRGPQLSDK